MVHVFHGRRLAIEAVLDTPILTHLFFHSAYSLAKEFSLRSFKFCLLRFDLASGLGWPQLPRPGA
jgi:hypothetical protein